ncbi:MAG: site-2 protease family protein [Baekduia sp.]
MSEPRWLPPAASQAGRDAFGNAAPSPAPERAPAPTPPPPPDPIPERRGLAGKLAPIAVAIVAFFGKFKVIVLALTKLKFLTSAGSMLVSIAAYAVLWGWKFAVGFVLLLFVHEMGHVWQLRREGLEASAPMFIPFMGAVVWAKSLGDDAAAEARVALAGPIIGSLGAAASAGIYGLTGNELFLALAFTGFFLNLFNLLPVSPLDGGRTVAAISPWFWLVGVFAITVLVLTFPNPILILIGIVAVWETYRRFKEFREGGDAARAYYAISSRDRVLTTIVYFGLIAALAISMHYSHIERTL